MALPGKGTFYPSWKLRLTIRFEEFGNVTAVASPPALTTKALNGLGGNRNALTVVADPANPGALLLTAQGQTQAQPATQQSSSADGLTYDITCIPREMDWNLNGVRTADQLTATLLFTNLPVDPRCVRSVAVEAFIGAVAEQDWAAGQAGQRRAGASMSGQGEPLNLVPDTYISNGAQRTNSRFQGWVDKWRVEFKDSEFVIQLECTDNTRMLINQEASPSHVVSMSDTLDSAVAKYLANFPQMNGLSVLYLPRNTPAPTLKNVLQNTAYRPNLGPQPTGGGATTQRMSVWDYLTDICRSIGHSIRIVGTIVVIQPVRSLMSSATTQRSDDPYRPRTVNGANYPYRTVIYGWNIKELKMARQYAKKAPTNVEVRTYRTDTKTVMVSRFPTNNLTQPNAGRLATAIPGNAQPEQKWTVFNVSGIKDQKTLDTIAQSTYEALGRQEFEVEVQTDDLTSFGGDNSDPDLFDMAAGDTFEVLTQRDTTDRSSVTYAESKLSALALNAAYMEQLGFSADFANAYAKAYTNAGFLTTFRLRQMKVHCSIDDGIAFHLMGVNYLEVRMDKSLPAGDEPGTTAPSPTPALPTTNQPQSTNPYSSGGGGGVL